MTAKKDIPYFHPKTFDEWYAWLGKHSQAEKAIRLVLPNKVSKKSGITTDEAVMAALCYGWIDSLAGKYDDECSWLTFTPRKPKGNWSKPNRERVQELLKRGLMKPQGQKMIDLAKETGTWSLLADIEEGILPEDVKGLLYKTHVAKANFEAFTPSSRKRILTWIVTAKRPETRLKRIEEAIALAAKNIRANHWELKQ